jgi:oligopeptide/dipeptide ABC transporter ATP-binding protein
MSSLIEARDVTVRFGPAAPAAVCSVSLEIGSQGALGIVGESGSGKTTLARALVGAIRPTSGSVLVNGQPWAAVRRTDDQRRRVQMVFQDPYGALNSWRTVRKTVAEVLHQWDRVPAAESGRAAGDLLREVGLADDLIDRRPRQLSGGQCQRVGIARALACEPDVLVADEPTSSLDVSVQAQILNLLASLRESRGLSLVVVSHDLGVVQFITTDLIVMYRGHVVEQGPTRELLASPRHPYTRLLVDSIPGQEGASLGVRTGFDPPHGCVFAHRCGQVGDDCLNAPPALLTEAGRGVTAAERDATCVDRGVIRADRRVACVRPLP